MCNDTTFQVFAFHQQKIEDFISFLSGCEEPNSLQNQKAAANWANLDLNTLTSDEIDYIEREVERKWIL